MTNTQWKIHYISQHFEVRLSRIIALDWIKHKTPFFENIKIHCSNNLSHSPFLFPDLRSPWPVVGKREFWVHPFWHNKENNWNSGYPVHCAVSVCNYGMLWRTPELVAPRALVFRPLVKGNEARETRLATVCSAPPYLCFIMYLGTILVPELT